MFGDNGQQQGNGGIAGALSAFGKVAGIGASILLIPMIFNATRGPLLRYFTRTLGAKFAPVLTWVMGAVEAYLVYSVISILITLVTLWAVTALASRSID